MPRGPRRSSGGRTLTAEDALDREEPPSAPAQIINHQRDAVAGIGEFREHPVDHRPPVEVGGRGRRFRAAGCPGIASAGLFGIFLFLTYYLQQTLGYSPLVTGVAFLPLSAGLILAANLSTTVLMPRFGPRPLVASGMLAAAGAMVWLAQLGPHTAYAAGVLGPTILSGIGVGLVIAPVINTGTFGVAPQDAGVASATVTVGQQLGASVGTSLLNTIFASAVTSYLAAHLAAARLIGRPALTGLALAHGYDTAFWWTAGIFAAGAVTAGALLRPGPLRLASTPPPAHAEATTAQAKADFAFRPDPGRS
jgi:Major Facilitator Superfamily